MTDIVSSAYFSHLLMNVAMNMYVWEWSYFFGGFPPPNVPKKWTTECKYRNYRTSCRKYRRYLKSEQKFESQQFIDHNLLIFLRRYLQIIGVVQYTTGNFSIENPLRFFTSSADLCRRNFLFRWFLRVGFIIYPNKAVFIFLSSCAFIHQTYIFLPCIFFLPSLLFLSFSLSRSLSVSRFLLDWFVFHLVCLTMLYISHAATIQHTWEHLTKY